MNRSVMLAALGLAGCAAATVYHLVGSAAPAARANATPEERPAAAARGAELPSLPVGARGEVRRYRADARSALRLEGPEPVQLSLEWNGEWTTTEVARDTRGAIVRLDLSDIQGRQQGDSELARTQLAAVQELDGRGFYLHLDERGRLVELSLPPRLSEPAAAVARTTAASLQVVRPKDRASQEWLADEYDLTGEYRVRYRRAGDGALHKSRLIQIRRLTPTGWEAVPADEPAEAEHLTAHLRVDADGRLEDLEQRLHAERELLPGTRVAADARLTLALAGRPESVAIPPAWSRELDTWPRVPVAAAPTGVAADLPREEDLAYLTVEAAIADLLTAPDGYDGRKVRTMIARELAGLFLLRPEAIGEAVASLGELEGAHAETVIGALNLAGTAEAQAGLVAIAETGTPAQQVSALAHIALLDEPNAASAAALRELARSRDPEVRASAILARGSVAEQHPHDGTIEELVAGYFGAATDEDRVLYLAALGNAGDARALEPIADALATGSPRVRRQAATSLRLVPGADADQLLARVLRDDPDPDVRRGAVFAVRYRPLGEVLRAALGAALQADESQMVRTDVIDALAAVAAADPAARQLLAWAAANDPDEDLRERAARALE